MRGDQLRHALRIGIRELQCDQLAARIPQLFEVIGIHVQQMIVIRSSSDLVEELRRAVHYPPALRTIASTDSMVRFASCAGITQMTFDRS